MGAIGRGVVVGLLAVLAACSNPLGPQEDAFRAARARWVSTGIATYEFDLRRVCFCGEDYTSVVSVVVEDGEIVAATYRDSGDPFPDPFSELYTIDDLFEEIRDAISRDAYSLDVEYDAVLGYPVNISIDYSPNIADEERGYLVTAFDFDGNLIQSDRSATTGSTVPARRAGIQLATPAVSARTSAAPR